ncbi:hypothetical protein ABEB36_009496 [Hypothenemus hampei]|uniref:Uncharacterized protein n=1 Tax=Hypothenemus hampei TaxID=57062 RepID=A0ABD1EIP7_HYPHA
MWNLSFLTDTFISRSMKSNISSPVPSDTSVLDTDANCSTNMTNISDDEHLWDRIAYASSEIRNTDDSFSGSTSASSTFKLQDRKPKAAKAEAISQLLNLEKKNWNISKR